MGYEWASFSLCLILVGTREGVLGKQINSLVSVGSTGKETSQQEIQEQTHSSAGDGENGADCARCNSWPWLLLFLNNVCDRIAVVVVSPRWMSRYCNAPQALNTFPFYLSKTCTEANSTAEGGGKNCPNPKEQPKPNHFNSCSVICWGHFREHLKMFGLVCVLFFIKADVEHDRSNFLSVGDGSVLPPTQTLTRRTRITGPW